MTQLPNLLIVDDKIENLVFLESVIKKINVNLIQALSGKEALEKVKGVELALAIIDVQMPEMAGNELAVKINEERATNKVPVVFLTASSFSEIEVIKGYNSGAVDYIFKPVDRHILVSKINVFLDLFIQKQIVVRNAELLRENARELKRVNNAISQSEEKYRLLAENIYDVIWIYNINQSRFIYISPSVFQLLGFTDQEVIVEDISASLSPDSAKNQFSEWPIRITEFQNGTVNKYVDQIQHYCKDGSLKWIEMVSKFQYAKDGSIELQGVSRDISGRKFIEEELRKSREQFILSMDATNDGLWDWDISTGRVYYSPGYFRMLGYQPNEFENKIEIWRKLIHPEDREIAVAYNEACMNNVIESINIEFRMKAKDGNWRWILSRGNAVSRDVNGKALRLIGTHIDITIRKRIEEALKESENKYRELVENSPDAIVIYINGKIVFANYETHRLLASSNTEELIGMSVLQFVHPDYREIVKERMAKAEYEEAVLTLNEEKFIRLDGSEVDVEVKAIPIRHENNAAVQLIISDITERKQAERLLIESRERYRDLVELAVDGVLVGSNQGIIIDANSCICSMLGRSRDVLIGMHISDSLFEPDSLKQSPFQFERLNKGEIVVSERKIKRADGSEIIVEMRTKMMPNQTYQSIYRDITSRKKAEEELKQLNEALEERVKERTLELLKSNIVIEQTRYNYETFFNTIDDFLFVLDDKGCIVHTNKTVIDRLGYTREELSGQSLLLLYPPDYQNEADDFIKAFLKAEIDSGSIPVMEKSGHQIPVETKIAHGHWDNKPVIFVVTKDISLIKLSEEKFSKVFHINPSACGLSNLDDQKYVEVNDAFYTLLEFSKDEVIGKTAVELGILSHKSRISLLQKADSKGNITNAEVELKTRNGKTRHVILSSENINLQDKKYRFTVVHDITEKKLIDKRIVRAIIQTEEREKAHFSKELHDGLGPLLSTIKLYLQWSERPNSNKSQSEAILKAAEILEEALTTVKEISNKLSPHLLTYYGLVASVQNFIDKLQETSAYTIGFNCNISRRYDTDIEVAIYRALIECLNNTIKHAKAKNINISMIDLGNQIKIQYKDDGIGFDFIENLTLQKGLGLFNLQSRIQSIGGKIKMLSKPGAGVDYLITINI